MKLLNICRERGCFLRSSHSKGYRMRQRRGRDCFGVLPPTAGGCRIFVFRRGYFEGALNARDCRIMEERRAALGELSLRGAA